MDNPPKPGDSDYDPRLDPDSIVGWDGNISGYRSDAEAELFWATTKWTEGPRPPLSAYGGPAESSWDEDNNFIPRGEEVWMLSSKYRSAVSRTHQSYITRSVLPCVSLTGALTSQVIAIDSDSSVQLAAGEFLQNIRMIEPNTLATISGTMAFTSVGDLMIPHHICGSTIVEAVKVKSDQLPTGCNAMLGRAGINACQLDVTRLGRAPPSIVPKAIYAYDPVPQTATFDHEVKDKFGKWHSVCWDGVVDERCGKRAFVLFKDGSTSLVRFTLIRDAISKSQAIETQRPRCILSSCGEPIMQGLCRKFCGRRTACSLEHYLQARDREAFVHPGYISPGVVFTRTNPKRSRDDVLVALAEAISEPPVATFNLPTQPEAERDLDAYVETCESAVQSARPAQLPGAWLRAAQGETNADYLSIFDGGSENINTIAASLGLVGLPPVDLKGRYPLNM